MADVLDSFLTGVPPVQTGAPSIFGRNRVSPHQAAQIVRNRVANEGLILGTRAKLNEFREREQATIQGRAALSELATLDPLTDPQYQVKVADIIARNPSATLDATVNNFLGIQEGIFSRADQDRRAREEEARRERATDSAILLGEMEGRNRARDQAQIERELRLEEELAVLPDSLRDRFDSYRETGLSPERAMVKVKEEAASAGALNELIESGLDPNGREVVGLIDETTGEPMLGEDGKPIDPGVYDPKTGAVDPRKVLALKSRLAREKKQKEDEERVYKDKENRLGNLTSYYKSLELSTDDALKQRVMDSITKLQEEMGLISPAEGGVTSDTTRATPAQKSPDIRDTDRYLPKKK